MSTLPETQPKPSYQRFLLPTLLMTVGGWVGLVYITNYTLPTLWPRWTFFALIVIALTGTTMPLVYFINRIFSASLRPGTVLRESILVDIFGAALAWLQLGRALSFSLGLWLAVGIVIIEYLIRWRENPNPSAPPSTENDTP